MQIAIALFPNFLALDALGPYQVLVSVNSRGLVFVAEERGYVSDGGHVSIEATMTFDEVQSPDVIVIPGGATAVALANDPDSAIVKWVKQVHPTTTWTTSVCTGALILGAAGVLEGLEATTHWYARPDLEAFGAKLGTGRYVRSGKVITSAGVSAGIDMSFALAAELAGQQYAEGIQLDMEYDPDPPFNAGSPETAPPEVVEHLTQMYDYVLGRSDVDPHAPTD